MRNIKRRKNSMVKLTERQRALFQQSKSILVDTIILLESKLQRAEKEHQFLRNEMLLCEESFIKTQEELDTKDIEIKAEDNKIVNRAMQDIEKQLDDTWEGNITSENFVEKVTQIMTGDYYDKIREKSTSNE